MFGLSAYVPSASQVALVVKNLPATARDTRHRFDLCLGGEDPLEMEMTTHSSILAWEIPWTEEPGGGAPVHGGHKESDMTEHARMHVCPS